MIEALEARIAPAGVVTASLKAGSLILTGDAMDNQIHIAPIGGGDFIIEGQSGTLIDTGGSVAQPFFFITNLPILGLQVDLGGGNDTFDSTGLRVVAATTLNGGDGNDTFTLSNHINLGTVAFTGGAGDDKLTLDGHYAVLRSKLTFGDTGGNNELDIHATTTTLGSISYTGGSGSDSINADGPILRGTSITANFGDGGAVIDFQSASVTLGGAVSMTCGEPGDGARQMLTANADNFAVASGITLTLNGTTAPAGFLSGVSILSFDTGRVGGALKVTGGHGGSSINVGGGDFSVGGGITFQPGAAADNGSMGFHGTMVRIGGDINYLGTGADDTMTIDAQLFVAAKKTILKLGDGENSLGDGARRSTFTGGLQYVGGSGEDSLQINGSVRGGVVNAQMGGDTGILKISGASVALGGLIASGAPAGSSVAVEVTGADVSLKTGATITGGAGTTSVTLGQLGGVFSAGADLVFTGGSGAETFNLYGSEVHVAKIRTELGDGAGTVNVIADALTSTGLKFRGGVGTDAILVQAGTGAIGLVDVNTGAGTSSLTVTSPDDQLHVAGINYNTANTELETSALTIAKLLVAGALNVNTGDGADTITGGDSIFVGPVLMQTKGGNDMLLFDATDTSIPSTFRGVFSVALGDGDDSLTVGNNTFGGRGVFFATVLVDAGNGNDTTGLVTGHGNFFKTPAVIKNSETAS